MSIEEITQEIEQTTQEIENITELLSTNEYSEDEQTMLAHAGQNRVKLLVDLASELFLFNELTKNQPESETAH